MQLPQSYSHCRTTATVVPPLMLDLTFRKMREIAERR